MEATDSARPRAGGRGGRSGGTPGSVWLRSERAGRGAPPLNRDRIVRAAVALLDEDGVERLTMRRLAERLGAGPASLYWHVQTKDDVVDLALDAVFGEVELPADPPDPTAAVRGLVLGWRAAMLRHPWAAALVGRPMLGPNVLRRTEYLHAALAGAGFTGDGLVVAAHAVANYVVGAALTRAAWHTSGGPGSQAAADEHVQERSEQFPVLAAHAGDRDADAVFTDGLDALLTGLTVRRRS